MAISLSQMTGQYGIRLRGTNNATTDTFNIKAAAAVLNKLTWQKGVLELEGEFKLNDWVNFTGDISLIGLGKGAIIEIGIEGGQSKGYHLAWNRLFDWDKNADGSDSTNYSFTMNNAFAEKFTPSGVTFDDGDYVLMWSDDNISGVMPQYGYGGAQRPMELHQVQNWNSTDAYVDSFIVDHMQTTPLCRKLTMNQHVVVRNLIFTTEDATTVDDYAAVLHFRNIRGLTVEDICIMRDGPGAISAYFCADVRIQGLKIEGNDKWDLVYGVVSGVCNGFQLVDSRVIGTRHPFTTTSGKIDAVNGIRWGTPLNVVVKNNVIEVPSKFNNGTESTRTGLSTHPEGWGVVFDGNVVDVQGHTANVGLHTRARNTVIRNNLFRCGEAPSGTQAAVGVLVRGPDTLLMDNVFENFWQAIVARQTDDEMVYCDRVNALNNRFRNCIAAPVWLYTGDGHVVDGNHFGVGCGSLSTSGPQGTSCHIQFGEIKQRTCTFDTTNDFITAVTAHGFIRGAKVRFTTTGALPTGITAGTDYFLRTDSVVAATWTTQNNLITTINEHGYTVGMTVTVSNSTVVDDPPNGLQNTNYTILTVPSTTTFTVNAGTWTVAGSCTLTCSTQFTIATSRAGIDSQHTFSGTPSGTHTLHGAHFPGTGHKVSRNTSYKDTNTYFMETNDLDESDVSVHGNVVVGYGENEFSNRTPYEHSATLLTAYQALNTGM